MKKTYQQPETITLRVELPSLLEDSLGVTSDKGIGYGGVDEEGERDPASRRTLWDEEEEEEEPYGAYW